MVKVGKWIAKHRILMLIIGFLLIIPSVIGMAATKVNYDLLSYLPEHLETVKGQDILVDEYGMGAFSMVVVENMEMKDVQKLEEKFEQVNHVKEVLWYDDVADISVPVEMIPEKLRKAFYNGDATMMLVLFDNTTSSDDSMEAIEDLRKIANEQCFIGGMTGVVTDIKNVALKELPVYVVIAAVLSLVVIELTSTSFVVPILFLLSIGLAILYNLGSNVFLGETSYITKALTAVLQLGVTMDYSIFLLHAFTQERATGAEPEQAMANAWRTAFSSIGASGMTTIVGFAAMALMNFGIGPDMGFVLAKGIALSLLTVLLLMPALILRSQNIIAKTQHRPFIPKQGRGIGEFAYKIRRIVFLVVVIIIIPCYIAQGMANFSYGNEAVANSPGTPVYEAEQQMNAKFGKSNMMIALVPPDSNITEKKMTEEIDDLSYVKYALSLSSVLPEGIPEDFLPENITSLMHSKNWARVIINVRSAGESDDAFKFSDDIRAIIDKYYPNETTYLVGVTPSTQDIKDIIVPDYNRVNIVSLLGVALVIAITYKALILPIVVLIPIECAIFINTALPYIYGQRTMYLGFIIVGCIQLGATVDYSILMTGNYLDARSQGDKKEAAIRAVSVSAESVMTSGLIVMTVAYGLYFMTSVEAISGLGQLIGRGALISVILVLFFLPMCLMLFDRWIVKSDYAEKKHAKMNKIRATKIKLPILSELHQQRVNLQNQIRENRKARNKELRLKLKNLMNGDGFKLPQNYTPPTQEPSKQQQTEESAHKRMIGKKLRMRIHNRIEMRKEQLEHLAQRLGSDKNKPNDSQNDNQNDNTEENDHENR